MVLLKNNWLVCYVTWYWKNPVLSWRWCLQGGRWKRTEYFRDFVFIFLQKRFSSDKCSFLSHTKIVSLTRFLEYSKFWSDFQPAILIKVILTKKQVYAKVSMNEMHPKWVLFQNSSHLLNNSKQNSILNCLKNETNFVEEP